jgi:hypothetical protein
MKLDIAVLLSALLAVLFIGTIGAFLLYVPALTVFSVAGVLVGLCLMFALGLATGTRWRKINRAMRLPDHFSVVR